MPKRGGGRRGYFSGNGNASRFSSLKEYQTDHNERENPKERSKTRRVSFKPQQSRGGMKGRIAEMAIRNRLEDDEDMGDFASSSKFDERIPRRKGSPIPKGKFGNRKITQSAFGWYQVTVQGGQRYSKDEVIHVLLQAIAPDIFIPYYWRAERNCIIFFVNEFSTAENLQKIDRGLEMPDGYRIYIAVLCVCPIVTVDEPFKEKMKVVMAKRYNATTRALDLSKFHADPDFKSMFCALFRTPVLSTALDIIEKNIPELEALNLNENHIGSLECFKNVGTRIPNLKVLYLAGNKLQSLAHLMPLRSVPIIELVLKYNPLCQRYKDHTIYVSEVRRKFPKLQKLDGEALQPQILFDVNESSSLPTPKASYLCDAAGTDIIKQFMQQYFLILDSDNRQPLLDAYHEHAMMSISVPPASQAGRLVSFWKFNRNFKRIVNHEDHNTIRQLKFGRLAIVSTLAEFPKTQHDPSSFSVDMTLFTPKLICFTIAGLFKEFDSSTSSSSSGDVRYFQRQLVIVPAGSGFCIRNELILITNATNAQARAFLQPMPSMNVNPVGNAATSLSSSIQQRLQQHQPNLQSHVQISPAMLQPSTSGSAPTINAQPDDSTKMQMVQAMSTQSNMNIEWSKKCLEETNWDYNHATFVFEKLQKESKIPPEAFIK